MIDAGTPRNRAGAGDPIRGPRLVHKVEGGRV
jgi:hypothetical protein